MPSLLKAGLQIYLFLRVLNRFDNTGRFAMEVGRLIDINDANIDDTISVHIPKATN